ncbi:unnamed protein product [Chironomus riparius]|uniref:inositol-polyphosphate 5-phosphatase n=1 Tax=Chironomus riparius TaxID=315576 RepID=A0A9N9S1I9_9DIPT|nr:unnamed protein product [Chironomus riparius]
MNAKAIECLLVTANCGSVFEDPSRLLENWIAEFLSHVKKSKPKFIGLHLQEVGGKTYEKSMEYVEQFIKIMCESNELSEFAKIRIYLDEDYNSAEHFTALGNLYFVHNSINCLKIWNFSNHEFEDVEGKTIQTGNIESVATKEKAKFPQQFFPECKWSRKGFLRTRWNIDGSTIDLINIHLFHDASNLAACEPFPSVYCKSRRRALIHTLERIHNDQENGLVPFFIFGDFNFRCDTEGVVRKLTTHLTEQRIPHLKTDHSKVQFRGADGSIQLTVGKKEFTHIDHKIFKEDWLKKFDRELEPLEDILYEFPISFSPTYPFEENPQLPNHYMTTRCPSWCDRILMTKSMKRLIENEEYTEYGIIGKDICMGDHKPVYLKLYLKTNQGKINNCDHVQSTKEGCKQNLNSKINACETCSKHMNKVFCEYSMKPLPLSSSKINLSKNNHMPLVSISVVDADTLNTCMCKKISDFENRTRKYINNTVNEKVCSTCGLIIKKQPMLVSKQVMLGDVIVNRIDSQFLSSTYSSSPSQIRKLNDPYTPESIESHSPQPEMEEENFINNTIEEDDSIICDVIKHKTDHICGDNILEDVDNSLQNFHNLNHSVSASQLQTRLEILRRESQLECSSKNSGSGLSDLNNKSSLNSKCLCCSCAIL